MGRRRLAQPLAQSRASAPVEEEVATAATSAPRTTGRHGGSDAGRPPPGYREPPADLAAAPSARRLPTEDHAELAEVARRIRRHAVRMVALAGVGYLGQAASAAELFAVLYRSVLRHGVDRFVLSPGHYAVAHYAAAVEAGLLSEAALDTYGADGSWIESISTERTPLLSATCGALGQALSVAAGLALADVLGGADRRTYVFCSDGEMQEGQVWEAAMFAAHRCLSALTVVIDANGSQVDGPVTSVVGIEPLADKWRSFGWHVLEVDGHDVGAVQGAFAAASSADRPSVVVARTEMLHGLSSLLGAADAHFVSLGEECLRGALADTALHQGTG